MNAPASLSALGLAEGASESEIEEAHAELAAYLDMAPEALRTWANDELALVDRAYADLLAHSADEPEAHLPAPAQAPEHATLKLRSRVVDLDALNDAGDLLDGHVDPLPTKAERRSQPQPQRRAKARAAARTAPVESRTSRFSPPIRRLAIAIGALAVLVVVAIGGFMFGNPSVPGISGTPAPTAVANQIDPAQVSALMEKISANPQDTDALQSLADLYYAAADYDTAKVWLDKLIAVDPKNVAALLGQGAVAYNTGDTQTAEQAWRAVLAIDDKNVEAHYDLGFMYFTSDPPKTDLAKTEWNRVIELVPDSQVAQTVRTHLGQIDAAGSSSSPAPSPTGGSSN